MIKEEIFIDFDGVILDTQKEIDLAWKRHGEVINDEWNNYLKNINWDKLISSANEINNSISYIKELIKLKKKINILTRVFSTNEGEEKIKFCIKNGILCPVILSPNRLPKSMVIIPNKKRILIDDSLSNCKDWISNNGKSYLFSNEKSNEIETINTLEKILIKE